MLRQSAEVVAAVPIFISSPLYRRWHLRWGATDEEVAEPMPGDELVPVAHFVVTRAITICAPPSAVWPWIMQVGFGRAGFYSYDLLDNLGRPSAEDLHMEWQQAHVGDLAAPMTNPPTTDTSFSVHDVKSTEYVVWSKPGSTWVWMLKPLDATRTRLVTRIRQRYVPRPATVVTIILSEFGDFAMMRKMLLGIKRRAERYPAPSGPGSSGVPTSPVPESGLRQSGVDAPAVRTPGGHRRFRETEVRALLAGEPVMPRSLPAEPAGPDQVTPESVAPKPRTPAAEQNSAATG